MSEYIEVGQPLQFTDPNTPTRVGEIVESVSDIYNILSPRLGMQVFVKSEKKSFVITSLKSKVINGVDVPEAAVEAFEAVGAKSITWNNDTDPSNMNDFTIAGVYDIKGERTRANDNLPVLNTGGGHSFNARLTVLDSSISGSGKDDDKCITQVLSFSNRLGQGEVYIRTGKGSSLDNLTWDKWSTLQRNVNVVSVESLGDLIDNGIYSGVLNPTGETFVLVVINNYALASKYGTQKCISQFKYSVNYTGAVVLEKRVKIGDSNWGSWQQTNEEWLNARFIELEDRIFEYIDKEIQDIIEGTNPDTIDSIKDLVKWAEEHGADAAKIIEDINKNTEAISNETEARIKDVEDEKARAEQAEEEISQNAIAADSMGYSTTTDDMSLEFETLNGKSSGSVTFPSATTKSAGVMSAGDKKNLDNVPSTIKSAIAEESKATDEKITNEKTRAEQVEQTLANDIANAPNLALRALFVAAGAEYNDSGTDKAKTAPWGESVTHKAGHYYLNGLGDITEEQMLAIYNRGVFNESERAPLGNSETNRFNKIRTNLCRTGMWNCSLLDYLCVSNKTIEVANLHTTNSNVITETCFVSFSNTESLFNGASKLSVIDTRCLLDSTTWKNTTFTKCEKLKELKIRRLNNNIVFKDSPLLSKATVLFMIQKSTTTSAITITLHADAYARLANDADIVAALEAQPLITLVSA